VIEIKQPIVGYSIVSEEAKKQDVTLMERPEELTGRTYKLKTPLAEAALYVTINDCDGKPFELFINSKDMKNYQWIVALTRVISAVFRHGGDCSFLIDELNSIQNPSGGYFKRGKYIPSLVAEIGGILEQHLIGLGLYKKDTSLEDAAKAMIAEKVHGEEKRKGSLCDKCGSYSVVILDNCATCLNCLESKCG
jgi:antirestriction protein ArdC